MEMIFIKYNVIFAKIKFCFWKIKKKMIYYLKNFSEGLYKKRGMVWPE